MIIDFAIKNFRSIKNREVFSMLPVAKVRELEENICSDEKLKLLRSCIIYGRNASGKSNLLKAFRVLNYLVNFSADFKVDREIASYEPFKLDLDFLSAPIELEINFIAKDGLKYNYFISYDKKNIIKEYLYFGKIGKKPSVLFIREKDKKIEVGSTLEKNYRTIEEGLYPNQLFLSKVGSQKLNSLIPPYNFLTRHFFVHTFHNEDIDDVFIRMFSDQVVSNKDKNFKDNIIKIIKGADTGITDISIEETKKEVFKFPQEMKEEDRKKFLDKYKYSVGGEHNRYKDGKIEGKVIFDIDDESTGTKKLLGVGTIIIDCLEDGDVVIIDELDKSLHPLLTKMLIQLFNNKRTNPKGAQLIFASHDVSLLSNKIFRRDQIWFSDKDEKGASNYYSLADLKGIRKEISYEKYYMNGAFGATPVINEYEFDLKFSDGK